MTLALLTVFYASQSWIPHSVADGITLETRVVADSAYESVRVRQSVAVPPMLQAEVIWGPPGIDGVANRAAVKQHEVLFDSPNERVYYQRVAAPLISDRDFVVRLWRRHDGDVHEIRWTGIDDARRPATAGIVRVQRLWGSCVIEPDDVGGSIVTYETFTDLGGALPPWMSRSPMRRAALEWLATMRDRGLARARASR